MLDGKLEIERFCNKDACLPLTEMIQLQAVHREMSSDQNPRKLLSWFNRRTGKIFCRHWTIRTPMKEHLQSRIISHRKHACLWSWSRMVRHFWSLILPPRLWLLLRCQNARGFWTNGARRNTGAPDGTRCRDITDTTHATAYSRPRTVERWNGTSGTPELRNDVYLDRVSAQL